MLVPEQRIRDLCLENKCGNYDRHLMCPPRIGSIEDIGARLHSFRRGLLLQYSRALDVSRDSEGLRRSKVYFHTGILQLEELLRRQGLRRVWGLIGGPCELCDVCLQQPDRPCPYPDKARICFTAIAVDILTFLNRLGLDNAFHAHKITWTGSILF